jgi:hypothetical protein
MNISAWQACQIYRQGVAALTMNNLDLAAQYFKQAGDGFAMSPAQGKFQAESRFAEAQARRLLKQYAQAAKLFACAAELLGKYDPGSPYLKAALSYMNNLPGQRRLHGKASHNESKLRALPVMADMVERNLVLKGKITQLDDGTKIALLKDNEFFTGGSKRLLPEAAGVDLSDAYVHKTIYKAFVDMDCLEFADLGGNYYTAPDNYKVFKSGGKAVVIGASDQFWGPVLQVAISGRQYGICMDLPGMSTSSHNILVVTDGQHILAIDPRTSDTWKLTASFSGRVPDFSWLKLTHPKKAAKPLKLLAD